MSRIGVAAAIAAVVCTAARNAPARPALFEPTEVVGRSDTGLQLDGGGGVMSYFGGSAHVGPAWTVGLTAPVHPHVALQATYTGATNYYEDVGARVLLTAIDGGVRWNVLRAHQVLQPFVTGGVGWEGIYGSGVAMNAVDFPVSAGAEKFLANGMKFGARFEVRPAIGAPTAWGVLASLGGMF